MSEGKLKEDYTLIQFFIVSIIFLFFVVFLFFYFKKMKQQQIKNERKEAVNVLTNAIVYYASSSQERERLVSDIFHITLRHLDNSHSNIGNFLEIRNLVNWHIIPSNEKSNIYFYQDFFDQLLKIYAEKLDEIYKKEDITKNKYQEESRLRDVLDRVAIDAMFDRSEKIEKEKIVCEKQFWTLHDILSSLGLKTWKSYKTYLLLK